MERSLNGRWWIKLAFENFNSMRPHQVGIETIEIRNFPFEIK